MHNACFAASRLTRAYNTLDELLGTKLRALYQRKKGRDLFDLATALEEFPELDRAKVIECFDRYMEYAGVTVTRS